MSSKVSDEDLQAWVDGELAASRVAHVLAAVVNDADVAARLDECLQLRALGPALAASARRRRRTVVAAAMAAAVLVVAVSAWRWTRPAPLETALAAALDRHRAVVPRLAWPAADRYRPYDAARAPAEARPERLPAALLARIEALGEPRAAIAAHVLVGSVARARQELTGAADTADAWSDRAAVALLTGDAAGALAAADEALVRGAHAPARWNRALALAGLGLDRSAAAAFGEIARLDEPGWSDEAAARAAALIAQRARRAAAFGEARGAAAAMVRGGPPALAAVDAAPALVRGELYEAVRAAGSPERVRALLPLARALDARTGGEVLVRHVERIAARPWRGRAELSARYAALLAGSLGDAERAQLVRDLRAAAADDLLLGALPRVGPVRGQIAPAEIGEYARLAAATGDPWFALVVREQRAMLALAAGDAASAARELEAAAPLCTADPAGLRCYQIERLASYAYQVMHRITAMTAAWSRSWALVAGTARIDLEDDALHLGIAVAGLSDDVAGAGLSRTRAFLEEWAHSGPSCAELAAAREEVAESLVSRNRPAEARAQLAVRGDCEPPFTARRAFVLAELARGRDEIVALRGRIAALREAATTTAGERAVLDHAEGRALLAIDPDAGRARLRAVARAAGGDPLEARARGYSYAVLVEEAARRGAWREALALLAEEVGAPPPGRCALGAAADQAAVFVALGPTGAGGAVVEAAPGHDAGAAPVPAALRAALAGCDVVDIYARAPYRGRADLAGPDLAARFRTGGPLRVAGPGPVVVVGNIAAPPALGLAPLQAIAAPDATLVEGAAATPARVLAAIADASFIELHGHGIVDASGDDAAMLVLAPGSDGRYGLTAHDVARTRLAAHPVVVLAACDAARAAPAFHAAGGLAEAFLAAGASAVIASQGAIADAAAPAFFRGVRTRIQAGRTPAIAVREERAAWHDAGERRWIDQLVVFQ